VIKRRRSFGGDDAGVEADFDVAVVTQADVHRAFGQMETQLSALLRSVARTEGERTTQVEGISGTFQSENDTLRERDFLAGSQGLAGNAAALLP
jgi:hypothetical protein